MPSNIKYSHPRGPNLISQAGAGERLVSKDGLRWALSANRKVSLPDKRYTSVKVWILKERINGRVVTVNNSTDKESAVRFLRLYLCPLCDFPVSSPDEICGSCSETEVAE